MIAGVPVVTTSYPASTFDALENDVHAVIEDDPAVFAQKVVDLYSDSSALVGFSERGRDFARRFNTWEESIRIIEENLISIAG